VELFLEVLGQFFLRIRISFLFLMYFFVDIVYKFSFVFILLSFYDELHNSASVFVVVFSRERA